MKHAAIYPLLFAVLLLFGCQEHKEIDPLLRSKADGLNKEAFVNRYRDPDSCYALSEKALAFIHDSLPDYVDGELRALNNMAFSCYQMSDGDNALKVLDRVETTIGHSGRNAANADIEGVIATLLRARLLQRQCRIADSYQLLYDIGRSGTLGHNRDNLLYSYAQTEYYITSLVLNFHYRNGREGDVRTLIAEAEQARPNLKVDYAQDMALNYALAYGWHTAGENNLALDYCERNFDLLALPSAFCLYHYANTVQMAAMALKSMPGVVPPDSVLALYDEAREAFFDYGDPYQMLGGVTSTARYALLTGDTACAMAILKEWRSMRDAWVPFTAPKLEVGYYELLVNSGIAQSPEEVELWFSHYRELRDYIDQNEREDFALQQTLSAATRRSRWLTYTALTVGIMALALLVLTVLLWINTARLRREKRQLEEANRRDVERIANVETCLSVLRHDVSPFIGYLKSPTLQPEVRAEVLEQLLRTFENIKSWTRLSVPEGMAFHAGHFALQNVFDEVKRQTVHPRNDVRLTFADTDLRLWGDRLLVEILLRNLVNNALQHTEVGSVVVSAAAETDMVDITVADTGCGMDAGQVDALFRSDRALPAGSEHGFGLILCRYIVKKHDDLTRRGCKLWVESTLGSGTTIHVRLAMSTR